MLKKSSALLLVLAAAVAVPTAVQALPKPPSQKPAKPPKAERAQQKAFLKSQLAAAKATVQRGKPMLKAAKADAAAAAKRELALRKPRLASKKNWEEANLAHRANPSAATQARLDAASAAHLPNKQAHEAALASKAVADARLGRLSGQQTAALNRQNAASREKKQGPNVGLRPRVAVWAAARSGQSNVATVSNSGVIYGKLPPAPAQQTNVYSNAGLAGNPPPFTLPPPPAGSRQYDVVPPLVPGALPPPVPRRPVRQNIYEQPDSPLTP
jgi:hypothetical protein